MQRLGSPLEEVLLIEQPPVLGVLAWDEGEKAVPLESLGQGTPAHPPRAMPATTQVPHHVPHSKTEFPRVLATHEHMSEAPRYLPLPRLLFFLL